MAWLVGGKHPLHSRIIVEARVAPLGYVQLGVFQRHGGEPAPHGAQVGGRVALGRLLEEGKRPVEVEVVEGGAWGDYRVYWRGGAGRQR